MKEKEASKQQQAEPVAKAVVEEKKEAYRMPEDNEQYMKKEPTEDEDDTMKIQISKT